MKKTKIFFLILSAFLLSLSSGCGNSNDKSSDSVDVSEPTAASGIHESLSESGEEKASVTDGSLNTENTSKTSTPDKKDNNSATSKTDKNESSAEKIVKARAMYEGIFLDNDEIQSYFQSVRGDAPYGSTTKDYHVTTLFYPDKDARAMYGNKIEVHIIGYKAGEIKAEDGSSTHNEGFKVELKTDDKDIQEYLTKNDRNFHITGSYSDNPGYTEFIDFSDADPLDITVTGTFGAYLDNGTIVLDPGEADRRMF